MSQGITLLSVTLRILPWVCVLVGATLFFVGLSWRSLTDSDTANGPFVGIGIVLVALGLAVSCATDMPKEQQPDDATNDQDAQPVKNMGSGAEFNQVRLPFVPVS